MNTVTPGPMGIPSIIHITRNMIHKTVSTTEIGIRFDTSVPSLSFGSYISWAAFNVTHR